MTVPCGSFLLSSHLCAGPGVAVKRPVPGRRRRCIVKCGTLYIRPIRGLHWRKEQGLRTEEYAMEMCGCRRAFRSVVAVLSGVALAACGGGGGGGSTATPPPPPPA